VLIYKAQYKLNNEANLSFGIGLMIYLFNRPLNLKLTSIISFNKYGLVDMHIMGSGYVWRSSFLTITEPNLFLVRYLIPQTVGHATFTNADKTSINVIYLTLKQGIANKYRLLDNIRG